MHVQPGHERHRFVVDEAAWTPGSHLTKIEDRRRQFLIAQAESRLRAVFLNRTVVGHGRPAARRIVERPRRADEHPHDVGDRAKADSLQVGLYRRGALERR